MASFQRSRAPPGEGNAEAWFTRGNLEQVEAQDFVTPGEPVRISGVCNFKSGFAGALVYPADVRVRIQGAGISTEQRVGTSRDGENVAFTIPVTPSARPGDVIQLSVTAEGNAKTPFSGWDTLGAQTVNVEVVSEESAQARSVTKYLPWAAGGAAAGALYSRQSKGYVDRTSALAGAGLGAAARPLTPELSIPDFPTKNTLALAALLGAGALAVNQVSSIGSPVPSVPSSVTDRLPNPVRRDGS